MSLSPQERDRLIADHQHLINATAARMKRRWIVDSHPAVDLKEEGQLGLVMAANRFEPGRRVKFSSMAITWIRGRMLEAIRQDDHLKRQDRAAYRRHSSTRTQLQQRLQRWPDAEEMAAELGISLDQYYEEASRNLNAPVYLADHYTSKTDPERSGRKRVPHRLIDDGPTPEDASLREAKCAEVRDAVGWLPRSERDVVIMHVWDGLTLKQVGQALGFSESRAHQIYTRAVQRMRDYLRAQKEEPAP